MELFIIDGTRVMPHPSTLMIEPFRKIWENNKVEIALAKYAYIEFMCSYKKSNPFIGYENPSDRSKKIIEFIRELDDDIVNSDSSIQEAITFYQEKQHEASITLQYYESAVSAAQKTSRFLKDIDLGMIGPKGYPIYKPADITRALKDTDDVLKTLIAMEDKVIKEITDSEKGKGGRQINYFEKSKK